MGTKQALYEELAIAEYWVVDVEQGQAIAYAIAEGGSKLIRNSQVLPGLSLSLVEEALQRSREVDQSQVVTWLITQFQKP